MLKETANCDKEISQLRSQTEHSVIVNEPILRPVPTKGILGSKYTMIGGFEVGSLVY